MLSLSRATVTRDWQTARAWLFRRMIGEQTCRVPTIKGLADTINSVLPGFTRNPYNTAYASGGSSGGTGVAIAANFATVGIGTDTGGSVRAPASINNLVGIRPTVGLVSRTGMGPLDSQRDTPGPMGRNVEDVARLLDVMVGVDPADGRTAGS